MDAVNHEVGRVTRRLADSNSFSPENLREDFAPLGLVALASLHDSFPNIEVLGLDYPVGLRVVSRDPNMSDPVLFSK